MEWKWPNFFLKRSKLNSTPLISHPVAMAQLPLQETSSNAFQADPEIRKPANFSMNWEWRKTKPLLRKSPLDSLSIENQPDVQSQLPLQETSIQAPQKDFSIPEERLYLSWSVNSPPSTARWGRLSRKLPDWRLGRWSAMFSSELSLLTTRPRDE